MPLDPIFRGAIQKGKILLEMPKRFRELCCRLEGSQVEVVLRKHKRNRSNQQNRYYWGVVIHLLAEHCGYEQEEMHDALKQKFLRIHDDTELPTVRSTASLNTAEFTEYIEQARRLAAEMGVYIPDPGQVD